MKSVWQKIGQTRDSWTRTSFVFQVSSDPSHFIFEINVGKSLIRHRTTLNFKALKIKGSSDPNHFIFEINDGKSRIWDTTTLKLNDKFLDRLKIDWTFKFRVVLCRFRLFPTLISKRKWLGSELPLKFLFWNFGKNSDPGF